MSFFSLHEKQYACSLVFLALFCFSFAVTAQELDEEAENWKEVEFKVNGESFTKLFFVEGIIEVTSLRHNCPMRPSTGWAKMRARHIELVPIRQFLKAEKIKVPEVEVEQMVAEMKLDPNPFQRLPALDLRHIQIRECMPMADLKFLLRTTIGMQLYAERKWKEKWPTKELWEKHCQAKKKAFLRRKGMYRAISFSIVKWPKGAANKEAAMAMRKKDALAVAQDLASGQTFEALALKNVPDAKTLDQAAPRVVTPFGMLEDGQAEKLRALKPGEVTGPIKTALGWDIVRREEMTDQEIRKVLKKEYVQKVKAEASARIAKQAKVVKLNWMQPDVLQALDGR